MKRLIVGGGLLVCALALGAPVYAGPVVTDCCACVAAAPGTQVFFCASPTDAESHAASERCHAIPDAEFLCVARSAESAVVSDECAALLAENSITCPVSSAAPTLGNAALAGLAGMLSIVGAWRLRRTARRG